MGKRSMLKIKINYLQIVNKSKPWNIKNSINRFATGLLRYFFPSLLRNCIKSVFSTVGIVKKSIFDMKKRTAFIGAILSFITLGQPLVIKTVVVLSTTGLILSLPEKVNAESSKFYFDRANEKANLGDNYGAISDYTKAIEIYPSDGAYYNRGNAKYDL